MTNPRNKSYDLENARILITGGSGYIASNLIQRLSDYDCEITVVSRTVLPAETACGRATIHRICESVIDIRNWGEILSGIDVVYHLAAQTSIYQANQDPEQDLEINVIPIIRILQTCKSCGYKPVIIFASTSTIKGLPNTLPVSDSAPDNPLTIYDLHKKIAEDYLLFHIQQECVTGSILRLTNVYGPGPKSSNADRGILNQMARRAIQMQDLTIYGLGNYIRDYIFIDDVVDAFIRAFEYSDNLNGGPYIIGSGTGHSIKDAFQRVQKIALEKTGKAARVANIDPPENLHPIEKRNFIADSCQFHNLTGWCPCHDLDEGLRLTIDYYLKNRGDT